MQIANRPSVRDSQIESEDQNSKRHKGNSRRLCCGCACVVNHIVPVHVSIVKFIIF